jgi:hypothetical protein
VAWFREKAVGVDELFRRALQMTTHAILNRWNSMVASRSPKARPNHDLVGFFQAFRPYGQDLPRALEGVVRAEEILPRLLQIYAATAPGWDERDAYFVVRAPDPLFQDQARDLILAHVQRFAQIAKEVGAIELLGILEPPPEIDVVQGHTPWPPDPDGVESLMYDARTDFIESLTPTASDALLLDDALYHLACDYYLRDYVLWPLYRQSSKVVEPFGSYFEMWKHGAGLRFVTTDLIKAFVPVLRTRDSGTKTAIP